MYNQEEKKSTSTQKKRLVFSIYLVLKTFLSQEKMSTVIENILMQMADWQNALLYVSTIFSFMMTLVDSPTYKDN